MKSIYFIPAITLGLLATVSCQKQVIPTDEVGQKGVLTVQLAGSTQNSAPSKVSGNPILATENAIKTGMVFVFRGSGANPALDGKASFDFTSATVTPIHIAITKGIRQIYAIANVDTTYFAGVQNLNDLYNITNKLSLTTFRTGGALTMSGFVKDADLTSATTASVPLKFVGSRISVDWSIANLPPALTGLVISGVAILNAKTSSNYFAQPITATTYYSLTHSLESYAQGYMATLPASFTGALLPTGAGVTDVYDNVLHVAPADKGLTSNYTYVLENNSPFPTIVAIYGTFAGNTYFWPIIINSALNGVGGVGSGDGTTSITRGNIYNVSASIKGLGYEDPYTPINKGTVDITITAATWNPIIVINQEFN